MLLNLINPGSLHRQTLHACAPKASVVTWNPLCRLKSVNRHMTDTVRYQTDHPAIYRHCWWGQLNMVVMGDWWMIMVRVVVGWCGRWWNHTRQGIRHQASFPSIENAQHRKVWWRGEQQVGPLL